VYIVCLWQLCKFRISLYCREKNAHVKVSFNKNIGFENQGVCIGEDDVYFNYTIEKNQLMNGSVPWRGACEKYHILMHMFIKALCKSGRVVIDVTASTGGFTILISIINI
jgi:predicted rRNA methylase YqxC with S4 and FtsJ domains